VRATAALGRHLQTHWAAHSDSDQGRAGSLHPDGQSRLSRSELRSAAELDRIEIKWARQQTVWIARKCGSQGIGGALLSSGIRSRYNDRY
jgi:hypothetical protein